MRQDLQLAGGVPSSLPPGRRAIRGEGGRIWDDLGNGYVDLVMGYGAVSIGHGEKHVVEAVAAQAKRGTLLPGRTDEEQSVREELCVLFPHTVSATLHKTGSEAVAAALRLARVATGRQLVVRCGFHGWHDEMIQSHRRWHDDRALRIGAPSPTPGTRNALAPLDWLDATPATLVAILAAHCGEIAAVILDPIQIRTRVAETLSEVAAMCRQAGALFILDELKTCPRVALGGVQEACGVEADLTIVGKGLANGFSFSAVLGPEWVERAQHESRIMGTFNGDLSGLAAVSATIEIFRREDAPRRLDELGRRLVAQAERALVQRGLQDSAKILGAPWPCMPQIRLAPSDERESWLAAKVAEHRALILCPHMSFVCLRHTTDDIDQAATAIALAVATLGGAD